MADRFTMLVLITRIVLFQSVISEYMTPSVDLKSCLYSTAAITITNATSGGLVYIRTDAAYNVIPSSDGTIEYECTFEDCNIKWDEKFIVVVQQKTWIQTSNDILISFICLRDITPITPIQFAMSEYDDTNVTTVAYTPDVAMTFYNGDDLFVSGSTVKIGTKFDMMINVTNNYNDFFDINVRSCTASVVPLIEDRCVVDSELFGTFTKISAGLLINSFYMFRPTSTNSAASIVIFSCVLEVCMESCEEYNCNTSTIVTDRRRRETKDTRRETRRETNPSMYVGSIFNVITEEITEDIFHVVDTFCMPLVVLITVIAGLAVLLISSLAMTAYCTKEYLTYKDDDNQIVSNGITNPEQSTENGNFAESCMTDHSMRETISTENRSPIMRGLNKLDVDGSNLKFGTLELSQLQKATKPEFNNALLSRVFPGIQRTSPSSCQYKNVAQMSPTVTSTANVFTFGTNSKMRDQSVSCIGSHCSTTTTHVQREFKQSRSSFKRQDSVNSFNC